MNARLILKEIGSRINNIGTIVDTDTNNDETTSYIATTRRISSLESKL